MDLSKVENKVKSEFDDFVTKKVENSPMRSGGGNKVGRGVDFVLASRLFVMLYSSWIENAEEILQL